MTQASTRPIEIVIQQHAEESAHLRYVRSAAHLDRLVVAGEFGSSVCEAALRKVKRTLGAQLRLHQLTII